MSKQWEKEEAKIDTRENFPILHTLPAVLTTTNGQGLKKKYIMFLCVVASSPELPTPTSPTTKTTKNEKFPHLLSHTQKSGKTGKTHDDDNNNRNVLGKILRAVIKFSAHDFARFLPEYFFLRLFPINEDLGWEPFFH